jgi:hypothetical protein
MDLDMKSVIEKSKISKAFLKEQFPEIVEKVELYLGDEGYSLKVFTKNNKPLPLDSINGFRITVKP